MRKNGCLKIRMAVPAARQRGVVLFIALIALVALSMAGIAMMRSIDAGNIIAGNLSFRQAALQSADRGLEAAFGQFNTALVAAQRDADQGGYYFSTMQALGVSGVGTQKDGVPQALTNANTCQGGAPATLTSFDVLDGGGQPTGFCVIYIIERMCTQAGPPSAETCIMPPAPGTSQAGQLTHGEKLPPAPTPFYRVTVRVDGPSNTRVYTQGFISLT